MRQHFEGRFQPLEENCWSGDGEKNPAQNHPGTKICNKGIKSCPVTLIMLTHASLSSMFHYITDLLPSQILNISSVSANEKKEKLSHPEEV